MKDNTVPLKLIALLANGEFHSGEQLGETLGMSRAAINKHIQTLRDWGVDVFTVPGKGYSLPEPIQLLNAEKILSQLDDGSVAVLPVIDSTNQYLLDRIGELKSGDACVAEYQHAGRGRRGRKWFSPFGANLYLSMFWRLEQGPAAAIGLSLVIGIVMAEVLRKLGADKVRVKWPNDLYLQDRKLAGILVELTGKTGDAAQIVIGAGINMAMRRVVLSNVSHLSEPGLWLTAIGLSQVISNVPSTILLLNYVSPSLLLAWAVNVGGFGLLPGSLANLIALRMANDRRIWWRFHLYSIPMLLWAALVGYVLLVMIPAG